MGASLVTVSTGTKRAVRTSPGLLVLLLLLLLLLVLLLVGPIQLVVRRAC